MNWKEKQKIHVEKAQGGPVKIRPEGKRVQCRNCGKSTTKPNTFGYCEKCAVKASKSLSKQHRKKKVRRFKVKKTKTEHKKQTEKAAQKDREKEARAKVRKRKKAKMKARAHDRRE